MNGKLIILATKGSKFSPYFVAWSGRGAEAFVEEVRRHQPCELEVLAIVEASSTEVSALQAEALKHGERVFGNWFARSQFLDKVVAALGAKSESKQNQPVKRTRVVQAAAPSMPGADTDNTKKESVLVS